MTVSLMHWALWLCDRQCDRQSALWSYDPQSVALVLWLCDCQSHALGFVVMGQ